MAVRIKIKNNVIDTNSIESKFNFFKSFEKKNKTTLS